MRVYDNYRENRLRN